MEGLALSTVLVFILTGTSALDLVPENTVGKETQAVNIKCQQQGAEIAWYRDGTRIDNTGNMRVNNNRLRIANLQLNQAGSYTCEATMSNGSISRATVELSVLAQCGQTPSELEHGKYKMEPSVEVGTGMFTGTVVTHYCDPGYKLHGEDTATCLPTGDWSSPSDPPYCEDLVVLMERKHLEQDGKIEQLRAEMIAAHLRQDTQVAEFNNLMAALNNSFVSLTNLVNVLNVTVINQVLTVTTIEETVERVRSDATNDATAHSTLNATLYSAMSELRELQGDVREEALRIDAALTDVNANREQLSSTAASLSSLNTAVNTVNTRITALDSNCASSDDMTSLRNTVNINVANITTLGNALNLLETTALTHVTETEFNAIVVRLTQAETDTADLTTRVRTIANDDSDEHARTEIISTITALQNTVNTQNNSNSNGRTVLQGQIDQMNGILIDLQAAIDLLNAPDLITDELANTLVAQIEPVADALANQRNARNVAFHACAYASAGYRGYSTGGLQIQFDEVEVNIGNHFSSSTFTCPLDGIYQFYVSIFNWPRYLFRARLNVGGAAVDNCEVEIQDDRYLNYQYQSTHASTSCVVHCSAGQTVYMETVSMSDYSGTMYLKFDANNPERCMTSFIGHIISDFSESALGVPESLTGDEYSPEVLLMSSYISELYDAIRNNSDYNKAVFSSCLSLNGYYEPGSRIMFENKNLGYVTGYYDEASQEFEAPYSGCYEFTYTLLNSKYYVASAYLTVTSGNRITQVAKIHITDLDFETFQSNQVIVCLEAGDTVTVDMNSEAMNSYYVLPYETCSSTFHGKLISPGTLSTTSALTSVLDLLSQRPSDSLTDLALAVYQTLNEVSQAIASDIEQRAVSFTACTNNVNFYVEGTPMPFPYVITNNGGHYSESSSTFTCPYDAFYIFEVTIANYEGYPLSAWIMLDGYQQAGEAVIADVQSYSSSTMKTIVECYAGSVVHVAAAPISNTQFTTMADTYALPYLEGCISGWSGRYYAPTTRTT